MNPTSSKTPANNPWFGLSMALMGVIVGYGIALVLNGSQPSAAPTQVADRPTPTPSAPEQPSADNVDPVTDDDNIRGDPDATISIIEYSDFECPFCTRHHPTMAAAIEEFDDVNWVYRHYPLGFHPNAQPAAEASECAADQGKFWEYSDILFERGVKNPDYVAIAEELGLDGAEFKDCMDTEKHAQLVKDQMAKGSAAGVRGTPGNIVINNKTGEARLVSGAQGLDAFKTAIEALR